MMDELFTPEVMIGIAAVNIAEYHRRFGMAERRLLSSTSPFAYFYDPEAEAARIRAEAIRLGIDKAVA